MRVERWSGVKSEKKYQNEERRGEKKEAGLDLVLVLDLSAELSDLTIQDSSLSIRPLGQDIDQGLILRQKRPLINLGTNLLHGLQDRSQLVRQPGHNRGSTGGDRVLGVLDDILLGEGPMSVSEIPDLVNGGEEDGGRVGVLLCKVTDLVLTGLFFNKLEELGMVVGAVGSEILQDSREGVRGHGLCQLEQVIAHRDHRIIRTGLSTMEHWLIRNSLIDHSLREHGLVLGAHNKGSELEVICGEGSLPHGVHFLVDLFVGRDDFGETLVKGLTIVFAGSFESLHGVLDELTGMGDHGDVGDDEAELGWVAGEGADQFEVAPDQTL